MKTVSYILSWEDASICTVYGIEHGFPCFTKIRDIDEDSYEVTITARIEDIPAIERRLAPYVQEQEKIFKKVVDKSITA